MRATVYCGDAAFYSPFLQFQYKIFNVLKNGCFRNRKLKNNLEKI